LKDRHIMFRTRLKNGLLGGGPKRLMWLYLLALLLVVWVVLKGGDALRHQQIKTLRYEVADQLNQLVGVLENAIVKYQHMPTLLASNDRVKQALLHETDKDIEQLNRELKQINLITEASDSYIINRQGLTIAASNYQKKTSFVGKNFAFRPYFKEAMSGKAGRYYALGTTSNRRGYYFSYPVYSGDKIIGVAVVKVDLTQFEKRFNNQSYEFLLIDPDGIVFSSSHPDWLYHLLGELSHQELQRIAESQRYKDKDIEKLAIAYSKPFDSKASIIDVLEEVTSPNGKVQLERHAYLQMSRPIQLLNFRVAIFAPLKTINEDIALWRAIFVGGVIITALLLGLATLRSRMLRERSDANEMARHNQAYIREVIQNTQAGLVTLDDSYQIESFNPAIERLLGQSLAPLVGQPLSVVFQPTDNHQGDEQNVESMGVKVLTQEGTLCYLAHDKRMSTQDISVEKSIPVEMTLCEMQLPNRRSFLVTFHDMTERKRYEQEITHARNALEARVKERTSELEEANSRLRREIEEHEGTQRELIQTAKLAVLGQLSAGLNHELNQPLTAIRAFAENGLTFLERNKYPQAKANLEQISQLGRHMGDIIARFKVFARKGDVQQGPIRVHEAMLAAVRIMASRYKSADIAIELPEDRGLIVVGDTVFLEQVLVNLLANAADAIQEAAKADKQVRVLIKESADKVLIAIQDTGKGLSEEAQKHLFEPFFTSKASGVGLGLGLSISQRIVEAMNGQIQAKNLDSGGAEFCVTLTRFQPIST